jgi:hypothetical protein
MSLYEYPIRLVTDVCVSLLKVGISSALSVLSVPEGLNKILYVYSNQKQYS